MTGPLIICLSLNEMVSLTYNRLIFLKSNLFNTIG